MCIVFVKTFKSITNINFNLAHIVTIMSLKNKNIYDAKLVMFALLVANLYSFIRSQFLRIVRHKIT